MTNNDFSIKRIYLDGNIEVEEYKCLLVPDTTQVHIEFNITPAAQEQIDLLGLRVTSGGDSEDYAVNNLVNNILTFTIPNLQSNTHDIAFSCIQNASLSDLTPRGEDNDYMNSYILIEETTKEFHNYVYEISITIRDEQIQRYKQDYSSSSPTGPNIVLTNLSLDFITGNIADIDVGTLTIRCTTSNDTSSPKAITLTSEDNINNIIQQMFSSAGYSDTSDNHLLEELNSSNYFSDPRFNYTINLIFTYNTIKINDGSTAYENIQKTVAVGPFRPMNSHISLQLVGKTKLANGNEIYGGVAIGQEPTEYYKGYPVFECGYPAFFNRAYFGIYQYGYYPGDTAIVSSGSWNGIPGYISQSGTSICFTVRLGQPIFATSARMVGNVIVRSVQGYIKGFQNPSGHSSSGFVVNIIDKKSGLVELSYLNSSRLVANSNGANITNNTPLFMTGASPTNWTISLVFS